MIKIEIIRAKIDIVPQMFTLHLNPANHHHQCSRREIIDAMQLVESTYNQGSIAPGEISTC